MKNFGGSNGEAARSIQQTTDQGYIIAGNSNSNDGDVGGNSGQFDAWVIKLDENGELEWEKNFGGSDNDAAYSIQQTANQGYIVAGFSNSNDGDVGGNNGGSDFWIIKLDEDGVLVWEKNFGGSGDDEAYSIQQTTDQGYIIAGSSESNDGDVEANNGEADFWVVKLDIDGALVWENNFGGSSEENSFSIQQTTDQGYIVAGFSNSNDGDVGGNKGDIDVWVIKLDMNGALVWENNFGGSYMESAESINQTADNGYVMAGYSFSMNGDFGVNNGSLGFSDLWVAKLTEDGELEWGKNFGGSEREVARSVQKTADQGYIVTGYSKSDDGDVDENIGSHDVWVLKINPLINSLPTINQPSHFDLVPNPSNGSFLITMESPFINNSFTVNIYDILGKTIFTKKNIDQETKIEGLPKGSYFITITNEYSVESRILIVQ